MPNPLPEPRGAGARSLRDRTVMAPLTRGRSGLQGAPPDFLQPWHTGRRSHPGAYVANNGCTPGTAAGAARNGLADLAGSGRPYLSDPGLAEREGRADRPVATA